MVFWWLLIPGLSWKEQKEESIKREKQVTKCYLCILFLYESCVRNFCLFGKCCEILFENYLKIEEFFGIEYLRLHVYSWHKYVRNRDLNIKFSNAKQRLVKNHIISKKNWNKILCKRRDQPLKLKWRFLTYLHI